MLYPGVIRMRKRPPISAGSPTPCEIHGDMWWDIWWFPEIGVPPIHPIYKGIFHVNQPFWGYQHLPKPKNIDLINWNYGDWYCRYCYCYYCCSPLKSSLDQLGGILSHHPASRGVPFETTTSTNHVGRPRPLRTTNHKQFEKHGEGTGHT